MLKETTLCMGCMNDKTYDGPCRLCGFGEDTPCIPAYLKPKTFLAERYIIGKVISYNGEGATYIGYDTATGTKVTVREFMPDTMCSRRRGEAEFTINAEMMPLYKTYLSEFVDLNRTLMKSRGMSHLQTVLDVFSENNTAYAVFEYISGISLKTYLSNSAGELTWEQAKELFSPIFTTLSVVHASGIIHRGISPATIFVTDNMELKLTGFCISAARTTNTEIACEVFAGYAAPEQYTSTEINGTWTDVYGIAAVLYRCLTGCTPTEAIARAGGTMLEPMMINRNIPANISRVIMRGLDLPTDGRIRSINEFVDRLFAPPRPSDLAPPDDPNSKKQKKRRRERAKTIAVLAVAGVVLAAFVVVFVMTLNGAFAPRHDSTPETEEVSSQPAITLPAPSAEPSVPEQTVEESSAIHESLPSGITLAMPDFTNRDYDTNRVRYADTFTFVAEPVFTSEHPKGTMFDQSIEAGVQVTSGITIEVKVSQGPALVPLPDYTGLSVGEYVSVLKNLSIKVEVRNKETNDVPNGDVAECSRDINALIDVEHSELVIVYAAVNFAEEEPEPTEEASGGDEESSSAGSEATIDIPRPPEDTSGIPVE